MRIVLFRFLIVLVSLNSVATVLGLQQSETYAEEYELYQQAEAETDIAAKRVFRDRYEKLSDLTEQEKNTIVEALVSNFGGASGKYSIDGDRLFFIPNFPANPELKDCEPSRAFSLNQDGTQLTLKGMMSRGYEVEEIWVKREDLD